MSDNWTDEDWRATLAASEGLREDAEERVRALTAQVVERDAVIHKLMLVVDDDEQIYNKDTDHERLIRAKRLIATHWGSDDFEWEPDE